MAPRNSKRIHGLVHLRLVSLAKALNRRLRSQDRDRQAVRPRLLSRITFRRPKQERVVPDQISRSIEFDEAAVGQFLQDCLISDLSSSVTSGLMQFCVDVRSAQ